MEKENSEHYIESSSNSSRTQIDVTNCDIKTTV